MIPRKNGEQKGYAATEFMLCNTHGPGYKGRNVKGWESGCTELGKETCKGFRVDAEKCSVLSHVFGLKQ